MGNPLPVVVSFGGMNAAGRSSGHQAYQRMIYESLSVEQRSHRVASLASLMGLQPDDEAGVLAGTLVRRIENTHFDVERVTVAKRATLKTEEGPASFIIARKDLPEHKPAHWRLSPVDESARFYRVEVDGHQDLMVHTEAAMPVQAAGQLPRGFDPAAQYRSQHHPRGLQLAILGASDAVNSLGVDWQQITECVPADQIAVYASSVMSQLDANGYGGMMGARLRSERVSSKQLALGMNSMPADFINAYVLGSVGATGAVTGACASFLYNLRYAVEEIKSGRRKVVLVGASEAPILPDIIDGYAAMSALATDEGLRKLDGIATGELPDYRRACRPFAENCGFTIAESTQYVVLMADDLAVELGANILAAVPGVYVNADGPKKSISSPGVGNYVTLAKAVGLARSLLGDKAVQRNSFLQAHGSSTPQNRVTESRIFHRVAEAFGVQRWPVAAIKSYLGHSLGPASGDQLACTLGVFAQGWLPGLKTIDSVAEDVYSERLLISREDQNISEQCQVAFLNSKGFGGNNASAAVFSPQITEQFLQKRYGQQAMQAYETKRQATCERVNRYVEQADKAELSPVYAFGQSLIPEEALKLSSESLTVPGCCQPISLELTEGYKDEF